MTATSILFDKFVLEMAYEMISEQRMKYTTGLVNPLNAAGGVVIRRKIKSAGPIRTAIDTGTASVSNSARIAINTHKLPIPALLNDSLAGKTKLNATIIAAITTPSTLTLFMVKLLLTFKNHPRNLHRTVCPFTEHKGSSPFDRRAACAAITQV